MTNSALSEFFQSAVLYFFIPHMDLAKSPDYSHSLYLFYYLQHPLIRNTQFLYRYTASYLTYQYANTGLSKTVYLMFKRWYHPKQR